MQRDLALLAEIIDAARQAHDLVQGRSADELATDRLRRDALLWNFTVLGEACSQLSEELRAEFPAVSWRRPVRLRNRIVHGYWSADLRVLRTTADQQLPFFVDEVARVLEIVAARS